MTTWGQPGSPPLLARTIGWTSVFTTSTSKPIEARSPDTNPWAPAIPSLKLGSVETLGKRMNSFSFSTGSNIRTPCAMSPFLPIQNRANPRPSVPEVTDPGEHHGHTPLVGGAYDLGVSDRSAGLDGRRGAGVGGRDEAVREREKGLADDGG